MIRIAMMGYWHVHAGDYTKQILNSGRAKIVGVYDKEPLRGQEWAGKLGVPCYTDPDALLSGEKADAVVVNTPTCDHEEIIIKAARAGKHIFTEKVLAASYDSAVRIAGEVKKAGVQFVISFPHRTFPHNLFVKGLLERGKLGTPTYMRMRNAHDGAVGGWLPPHFYDPAEACGGAMMDLGAHPMYLIQWLMGTPESMFSVFTHMSGHEVEDNAVSVMSYANGAIAVSETGFMTPAAPEFLEVQGTEGTVQVLGVDNIVWLKEGKAAFRRVGEAEMPPPGKGAMEQFLDAVETGESPLFGIEDAVALSRLMDAAYRSHREKRLVTL